MDFYTLRLCGIERKLPLSFVSRNTRLASFTILGDVELVDRLADTIADKLRTLPFDYLVGPEVKVVPLIHGVAKRLGHKRFILCRKSVKPYMISPIILKPLPHFPKHIKQLVINGSDAELLRGKRVVVIDDVVSTGVTIRMIYKLMEKVGSSVVKTVVVLKQGNFTDSFSDLWYLGELPFFKSS
ncbi:adenine phosphoribosyltransferase [Candidatus Gottesmanbacteria bacterium]|nr:adenine phosphoribosyltransferase [Candidatus Gottesmanbacteria bacterium]